MRAQSREFREAQGALLPDDPFSLKSPASIEEESG